MCISGSSHSPSAGEAAQQRQLPRASFQWNLASDAFLRRHPCSVGAQDAAGGKGRTLAAWDELYQGFFGSFISTEISEPVPQ